MRKLYLLHGLQNCKEVRALSKIKYLVQSNKLSLCKGYKIVRRCVPSEIKYLFSKIKHPSLCKFSLQGIQNFWKVCALSKQNRMLQGTPTCYPFQPPCST